MEKLTLVIGNKNYSSWSLRAWLTLKQTGEPFQEIRLPLHTPEFEREIAKYSPSGKVPVLIDSSSPLPLPQGGEPACRTGRDKGEEVVVWESLAICEYLAEKFPKANLWPKDYKARAFARAISNEMHAGFLALRKNCPVNIRERNHGTRYVGVGEPAPTVPGTVVQASDVQSDIDRITSIWREARERFGVGGPFLFGHFTVADAMYAPVVTRFVTYDIQVDPISKKLMDTILSLPALKEWVSAAEKEVEVLHH